LGKKGGCRRRLVFEVGRDGYGKVLSRSGENGAAKNRVGLNSTLPLTT
jgi:hypothetical protein